MKVIATFDIPNPLFGRVNTCSTAVLSCTDFRFHESDGQFSRRYLSAVGDRPHFDRYVWPGTQKDILEHEAFRWLWLDRFERVSARHHGVNRLMPLMHWDCFGYGGLKEEEAFRQQLAESTAFFRAHLPGKQIVPCYSKDIPGTSAKLRYVVME